MDPPMGHRLIVLGALVLVALLGLLPLPSAAAPGPAATSVTPPLTGNVTGPSLLSTSSNGTFYLNATGGPAVVSGDFVGEINWTATLSGPNTTGSSVSPSNGTISNGTSQPVKLTVTTGAIRESLTLTVEVKSALSTANKTANLSKTFAIVTPYIVRATLVAGAASGLLPFNVTVALDGTVVGTVTVPKLAPNETWAFVYRYPSTGLPSGEHTFTLTIADAHGLVAFANGATVETASFYVGASAPNNTVWYVAGVVAFFGVLFIYATRSAARRRAPGKR